MILEAYRELLRDVFDIPALVDTLRRIEAREIRTVTVDSDDPVAVRVGAALRLRRQLHLRRRRAAGRAPRAGAVDRSGAAARAARRGGAARAAGRRRARRRRGAAAAARRALPRALDGRRPRPAAPSRRSDAGRDRRARLDRPGGPTRSTRLTRDRRIVPIASPAWRARSAPSGSFRSSTRRAIAMRSACRCRRACPSRCSRRHADAALDLARRYARTHGPFTTAEFAARYALGRSTADALLKTLAAAGRLLEGEFRPGGSGPRVVRRRRPADDPPPLAREAAEGSRAGRTAGPRAAGDVLAGARAAAAPGSTRCST